jgi:hypothetical protein
MLDNAYKLNVSQYTHNIILAYLARIFGSRDPSSLASVLFGSCLPGLVGDSVKFASAPPALLLGSRCILACSALILMVLLRLSPSIADNSLFLTLELLFRGNAFRYTKVTTRSCDSRSSNARSSSSATNSVDVMFPGRRPKSLGNSLA